MFTIKHIRIGGDEEVFSATETRFAPGTTHAGKQGEPETPPTLWFRKVEYGTEWPLTGGTIFVMNERGSTVARYDLGASPVPIIAGVNSDPCFTRPVGTAHNPADALPQAAAA